MAYCEQRGGLGHPPLTIVITALVAIISTTQSVFAQCERGYRSVSMSGGVARVRSYDCNIDGGNLRIEFHRLNDVAIGSILMGRPFNAVAAILDGSQIIENDVYKEVGYLFQNFGARNLRAPSSNGFELDQKVDAPTGGLNYQHSLSSMMSSKPGAVFDIWDIMQDHAIDIPREVSVDRTVSGYHTMTSRSYAQLNEYMRRQCSRSNNVYCNKYKYLSMLSYMGGNAELPEDLRLLYGEPGADGCVSDLTLLVRPILLEVMLIENKTGQAISVDEIVGLRPRAGTTKTIRRITKSFPSLAEVNSFAVNILIPAGHKALIPTRIVIGKPGDISGRDELSRITNEYSFGPEMLVSGLRVGARRIMLSEASRNYVEVTAVAAGLSCPYLYAWDADRAAWLNYGKIIHEAQGKERKATQLIELSGFATRFRISEEEPEVAFISQIVLDVTLRDGSILRLERVKNSTLQFIERVNEGDIFVPAFRFVEIEFKSPSWLNRTEVARATQSVTGYYQRMSSPKTCVASSQISRK